MWHEGVARDLTRPQREQLIAHIDCPQLIARSGRRSRDMLLKMGLLFTCAPSGRFSRGTPKFTALSEDGRAVLGWVLAEAIELLVRAGYLDNERERRRDLIPTVNSALTELRYRRGAEGRHVDEAQARGPT